MGIIKKKKAPNNDTISLFWNNLDFAVG